MVVGKRTFRALICGVACPAMVLGLLTAGCNSKPKGGNGTGQLPPSHYPTLPPHKVPEYMANTIYQRTDLAETNPLTISGYGLVVNLRGTGNSQAPTPVRQFIVDDMKKRSIPGPEKILADPRVAIVEVYAEVPPGVHKNDMIDARVAALPGSYTTSLSGGTLYETSLFIDGANPMAPEAKVFLWGLSQGDLLVNPAYALIDPSQEMDAQRSLRNAAIPNGVRVKADRAIILQLRQPQYAMSRAIEERINERFQDRNIAHAQDDGVVRFMVPAAYGRDWEHFSQLVTHLYMTSTPGFSAYQGKILAQEAVKPGALLKDISFCFEGLGRDALPAMAPLLQSDSPDVAFAAARAGAFLADSASQAALIQMARTQDHPFQLNAVQTLGKLPYTPMVASVMREMLSSNLLTIRLAAYSSLCRYKDPTIISKVISERYVLDMAPGSGKSLVFMSRSGIPRIGLIGTRPRIQTPITFAAMDNRLTISSTEDNQGLVIFYRSPTLAKPLKLKCDPDIVALLLRLGGDGPMGEIPSLGMNYSDIVAIISQLAEQGYIVSGDMLASGQMQPTPVVLEGVQMSELTEITPITAKSGAIGADSLPQLQPDSATANRPDNSNTSARPQ